MTLLIKSAAFEHQSDIPARHTCDQEDVSPPLAWSGVPEACKSLVLIVEDPDAPDPSAPRMVWSHWLLYNIPPETRELTQAMAENQLPAGTLQGKHDWHATGYRGPCPPIGRHRYFFKLFALDCVLPNLQSPDKKQLENAMQGHILEQTALLGYYAKH